MRIEKGKIVEGGFPKIPDLEEGMGILMQKIKDFAPPLPDGGPPRPLTPTPPDEGPPLPRVIELKWPKFLSKRFPKVFIP